MAKAKVYSYKKCSTCVKALKFLNDNSISFDNFDITEKPPSKAELEVILKNYGGEFRKLFNTSGVAYRDLKLKEKMSTMTKAEALTQLSTNGRLVKRPFVLKGGKGLVGFKEEEWAKLF